MKESSWRVDLSESAAIRSTLPLIASWLALFLVLAPAIRADVESVRAATPPDLVGRKSPLEATPERIAAARQRYLENCVLCHGAKGDGRGPASRALRPHPMNFSNADLMATVSDGELFHAISAGSHGSAMLGYAQNFDEEKIWELVVYLRKFSESGDHDTSQSQPQPKPESHP